MITFVDGQIQFDYNQCQQCGACVAVCPTKALSIDLKSNGLANIKVNHDTCIRCLKCERICPANKRLDYSSYFEGLERRKYLLAYNGEDSIRTASSSGGACKTLIIEALRSGAVDAVYSLRRDDKYPFAHGELYEGSNIPNYDEIPNSVYNSIMQCLNIVKIKRYGRLMIVGTACQLRALEVYCKGRVDSLVKVCIFCKQQKTLDSTRFLAKMAGTKIEGFDFRATYRGDGWPGTVTINGAELPWHRAAQLPFGRRLWTVPGCNVCGDPFGFTVGADLSLMDPWNIRKANELGETLMVVNSAQGEEIIASVQQMKSEPIEFRNAEAALGIRDIRRKQLLVTFFRGEKVSLRCRIAGVGEQFQRKTFQTMLRLLPRMPIIFYRMLCKLPDLRNLVLK